jgi:hypothetical protein
MDICYALKSDCFTLVKETVDLVGGKQVPQRQDSVKETSKNDWTVFSQSFFLPQI